MRLIELKQKHGHPADRGPSEDEPVLQPEMSFPSVPSRMKQPHNPIRFGVNGGEVRTFVAVTGEASPGHVGLFCLATVLGGNDVSGSWGSQASSSWSKQYSHGPRARSRTNVRSLAGTGSLMSVGPSWVEAGP